MDDHERAHARRDVTPEMAWRWRGYRIEERPTVWFDPDDPRLLVHDGGGDRGWISVGRHWGPATVGLIASLRDRYLPPAHRRQLAEAIGAGDFAECEGAWERVEFHGPLSVQPLDVTCPCGGGTTGVRYVPALLPFDYWCGQCRGCGVIYWHRGEERRDAMYAGLETHNRLMAEITRDLLDVDRPGPEMRGGDFTAADLDRLVRGDP